MKHNIGESGEYAGHDASFQVEGWGYDVPGMNHDALRPTCYDEDLYQLEGTPAPVDGQPVEVSLRLDGQHRLTATVPVKVRDQASHIADELGCPASRRSRRCDGDAEGNYLISITSATKGISCRRGLQVLQSVARWASGRCYRDLCARHHRRNRGFGCSIALAGEAFWEIVCRRGKQEVRGFTAE